MITIAHIADLPGSNAWLNGIVDHADRSRFRHVVIQLGPRNGLHDALEERGIEALTLGVTSRKQYPFAVARLASMLRRRRVDVMQTHLFDPTSVGLAAARLAGTPLTILTRHHADFTTLFNKPIHRRIDRWHALFADQIWTPSEFIKDCMVRHEGVPGERITVLPLAFNFDVMKPSLDAEKRRALRDEMGGNDDYIIGMVGRLSVEKGHEYLLAAMPEHIRRHTRVRHALYGDGPRRPHL
jgi:glycosyltransferase involved in cell wall biosynthesis